MKCATGSLLEEAETLARKGRGLGALAPRARSRRDAPRPDVIENHESLRLFRIRITSCLRGAITHPEIHFYVLDFVEAWRPVEPCTARYRRSRYGWFSRMVAQRPVTPEPWTAGGGAAVVE